MVNSKAHRQFNFMSRILKHLNFRLAFGGDEVVYIPLKKGAEIRIPLRLKTLIVPDKQLTRVIVRDITHEVGHYLVTPKNRRHRKNFGIPIRAQRFGAVLKYDIEELRAQVIEKDLTCRMGLVKNLGLSGFPRHIQEWWIAKGKQLVDNLVTKAAGV